jgi:hypothetical protein
VLIGVCLSIYPSGLARRSLHQRPRDRRLLRVERNVSKTFACSWKRYVRCYARETLLATDLCSLERSRSCTPDTDETARQHSVTINGVLTFQWLHAHCDCFVMRTKRVCSENVHITSDSMMHQNNDETRG